MLRALHSAVFRLAQAGSSRHIQGAIERPNRRHVYARSVDVRGWVAATAGTRPSIRVAINGRLVRQIETRREPASGDTERFTFDNVVDLDGLRLPAIAFLTVTARAAADARERRVLGISLLQRQSPRRREVPRHAYQQTWDAVSRTLSDARFSVAGTADTQDLQRSGESTAADIRAETGLGATDRVLEIGCGVGRVGSKLAPHCREWVGADVSANMLRYAGEALRDIANARFVHLNGFDLAGLETAALNVVYCTAVFMHLDEWDRYRYIEEAHRVLKPGGRLYVDNFSLTSPEGWRLFEQLARMDTAARPPNISKSSTPEELRTFVEHAGFEGIRVRVGALFATVNATKPTEAPAVAGTAH